MTTTEVNPQERQPLSITKGFQTLTINPAPLLRRSREEQSHRDPVREAWQMVGDALWAAVRRASNSS